MADEHEPNPPERPAGQWGPPPPSPPPAPSPPAVDEPAPGGAPAAPPGGWAPAPPRAARRIPLTGAVVAALGLLLAGVFTVLAALIDMVRADDAFGNIGFGGELDFLDRVAIGMNRLDVRVALLLPLALVLVRPALDRSRGGAVTDRPTRWVVAGTAFLAGALLFLISLNLVAALTVDQLSFTSKGAAFFDNLAALAVAAGAGLWAWRDLQVIGEPRPTPQPAPGAGASPSSAWPPAPADQHPGWPPSASPETPPAEGSPPPGDEQQRRWGPPPV